MHLSVIIPAYNESERIGKTLESVNDYLSRQPYDYEVIVVNDGSTDNTAEVVKSYQGMMPYLTLLNNKNNSGKGGVVRQGMMLAHGEYRLFMDADNSTTIDHIEKMLPYLDQGYDIAVSSRRIKGAELTLDQ
ncbi:MAG TPA: glycosyltransferase, partial [Candidatus Paceibacterota bacterium]|nr:glycosyltransferase [Candidatus Paceibacterota bacterium]